MAPPKKQTKGTSKTTLGSYSGKSRPITGFFFLVIGTLMLISLIIFDLDNSSFKEVPFGLPPSENASSEFVVGVFGEYIAFYSLLMFGFSAWVISFFCFWLSYLSLFKKSHFLKWPQILAIFAYTFSVSALGALIQDSFFQGREVEIHNDWSYAEGLGGLVGNVFYTHGMRTWFGPVGTSIVLAATLLLSLILLFTSDFSHILERSQIWLIDYREKAAQRRLKRKEEKARRKEEALNNLAGEASTAETVKPTTAKFRLREEDEEESILESIELEDVEDFIVPKTSDPATPVEKGKSLQIRVHGEGFSKKEAPDTPLKIVATQAMRKALKKSVPQKQGNYIFPTLALLKDPPEKDHALDKSEHEATAAALIQTLANFKVSVRMGEVHTGPVITRYEVHPAPGVKVGKILGLENDIALGLKALAVRIQAPVPGKGTVGIEVPNKRPEAVYLRDIIESEDWENSTAEIPIALGKEVSGRPLIADLTKMPHLLVAGATGSGKTVCINTIIASLVYHSSPEDIRFIMVDPKIVEMQVFNDLPHMMIPVVTDPKKVPGALKWLIAEMERRYQIFAKLGVRNIAGFNDKQKQSRKEASERKAQSAIDRMAGEDLLGMDDIPEAEAPYIEVPRDDNVLIPEKFPYIVCIIDELADLMMVAQQDVEVGIARLAQLARAAGIHLIIATQRPSVNVITGIIKANLPSRIAFQVSSKVDSRTILDEGGAEQLIGRGDMLFNPPGSGKLLRSQGCFVSDEEINNIVEFLKQNGPPQFVEEVQRQIELEDGEDIGELQEEEDDLFPAAIDVLRGTGRASTSMLQRRLKIGYNRAARIMDLMEARGIVGPDNGSKPRDILMDLENL
ncbi:MAG: DNA translocase FtsK [Verrucomicrobia bacterium]|nr:DNA translocase FtsK [Verrucomicrobiota bacterium]MDA1067469.1 DNA translocase FtsK [Verrucomicrobiota bacterium]